jgi:hypothetical protein
LFQTELVRRAQFASTEKTPTMGDSASKPTRATSLNNDDDEDREQFVQSSLLDADLRAMSVNLGRRAGLFQLMELDESDTTSSSSTTTTTTSSSRPVSQHLDDTDASHDADLLPVPQLPSNAEQLDSAALLSLLIAARDRELCNAARHEARVQAARREREWLAHQLTAIFLLLVFCLYRCRFADTRIQLFFSPIRINALYEQCGRMPTLGTQLRSSNDSTSTTASTTSTSPEHALHALSLAFAELTSSLHDAQHTARVATEEYLVFVFFVIISIITKKKPFSLRVTVLRSQLDELKLRLVAEFEKRQQLPSPAL